MVSQTTLEGYTLGVVIRGVFHQNRYIRRGTPGRKHRQERGTQGGVHRYQDGYTGRVHQERYTKKGKGATWGSTKNGTPLEVHNKGTPDVY